MADRRIVDRHKGIGDQHLHAERPGKADEITPDGAIADDADAAAGKLPSHHDVGRPARVIVGRCARHTAGEIDHVSDGEFGDGLHEARACLRNQHATSRGCRNVVFLMSTAQRTKARKFGSFGNISPGPWVMRSATTISTSRAASMSAAASSARSPSCSFTSATAHRPARLRSP